MDHNLPYPCPTLVKFAIHFVNFPTPVIGEPYIFEGEACTKTCDLPYIFDGEPYQVCYHSLSEETLRNILGLVFWVGRDESERRRAESQWIVAARPLCHLQYPVTYLSRLQRILPVA